VWIEVSRHWRTCCFMCRCRRMKLLTDWLKMTVCVSVCMWVPDWQETMRPRRRCQASLQLAESSTTTHTHAHTTVYHDSRSKRQRKKATENWAMEKWATGIKRKGDLGNYLGKMGNGKWGNRHPVKTAMENWATNVLLTGSV